MNKAVVILRGLPGSGKSTIADNLSINNNGVVFSTDNFFIVDGEYKFDGKYIGDAHTWNKLNVLKALRSSYPYVIVDNTNTQYWEMEPYIKMAFDFDYEIAIVEPDHEGVFDVDLCFSRNKHGVPKEVIQKMKDRWETTESIYNKIAELAKELNVKQN
jgi:NEDD4-binding protein 2